MPEVFAIFHRKRTVGNLTFYQMEGKNLVRKKSSLTRRKVLYSPGFERTRYYAGLMGKASKIGSFLYNALPVHWRQSWMYRSFTGEALTLLKAGKPESDIKQLLWQQYVKEVVEKQRETTPAATINAPAKRVYRKQHTDYWNNKTIKSQKRQAHKQRVRHNANLLAQAAKLASQAYQQLPLQDRNRSFYQQLTGMVMQLLKAGEETQEMTTILQPKTAVTIANDEHRNTIIPPGKKPAAVYISSPTRTIIAPLYTWLMRMPVSGVHRSNASLFVYPLFVSTPLRCLRKCLPVRSSDPRLIFNSPKRAV